MRPYLLGPDGEPYNGTTFDLERWYATEAGYGAERMGIGIHPDMKPRERLAELTTLLRVPEARALLTRFDPMLFAVEGVPEAVHLPDEPICFSDLHLKLYREAYLWRYSVNELNERLGADAPHRFCLVVGPRESGKTHMIGKILPLWAACHGYIRFYIFAANDEDAAKRQKLWWTGDPDESVLDTNRWLAETFPAMTETTRLRGFDVATGNGFRAKFGSIMQKWRGAIAGNRRPDYLVLDDIDAPDEGEVKKREDKISQEFAYLGRRARMYLAGTTTTSTNITWRLLRAEFPNEEPPPTYAKRWRRIYCPPIREEDGAEFTFWPGVVSLAELQADRDYALENPDDSNYWFNEQENKPRLAEGNLFTAEMIRLGQLFTARECLFLDPADTTKASSDQTGICVTGRTGDLRVIHRECYGVRLAGDRLREHVRMLLVSFPTVTDVYVDSTKGGYHWKSILSPDIAPLRNGLGQLVTVHPIPFGKFMAIGGKDARVERASAHYRAEAVLHAKHFPALERQMIEWAGEKKNKLDDLIDVATFATVFMRETGKGTGRQKAVSKAYGRPVRAGRG